METSPLICTANQWTGFYMIGTFVMKEANRNVMEICVALAHLIFFKNLDETKTSFLWNVKNNHEARNPYWEGNS